MIEIHQDDSLGPNCNKLMCKITESVLVAHCLDCPTIIKKKYKVCVNLQKMYYFFLYGGSTLKSKNNSLVRIRKTGTFPSFNCLSSTQLLWLGMNGCVCVVIICKEKKKEKKKSETYEKQSLCSTSHFPTCPMDQIDTLCLWQFCVLPVVQSLWQRTDAVLQLHTHIQKPCYPLHLWQWRRSYSPHAHVRSPEKCGQEFSVLFAFFFFFKALQINSVNPRLYCNSNQNSRPISHQWSWCLTWKCWPRSSACACLATEQLLPYPGEKKQKHYSIEGKWYPPNRCIYTKALLNSFKKQFWYFLHENQQ